MFELTNVRIIGTQKLSELSELSESFAKTVSFFLRASNDNSCKVEVTGKRVNLGDGQGLQIPCKLHFIGNVNLIDKLKEILPPLM